MATEQPGGATYQHGWEDGEMQYSLPCSAEELYESRAKHRQAVIDTAREMASITIPSVYPPLGYIPGSNINDDVSQSFNAMCVNSLASKMMFLALPPDRPVVRFEPIEHILGREIEANPKLWTLTQIGLAKLEMEHRSRLEATSLRATYTGASKALLIAGNILWEHMKLNSPVFHLPDNYIVIRNKQGEQLLVILKRCVELLTLDPKLKKQVYAIKPRPKPGTEQSPAQKYDETVDIYAVCKRIPDDSEDGFHWEYWEEYEGEMLDGTQYEADADDMPLYAAWMIPVHGKDWGRSYCEEYRGDLYKINNLESAENDGAAVASLILLFLKAGSRTSPKQIKKAKNMSLLTGHADDLTAFHLDKSADFAFITDAIERASRRLGRAFLLVSSVQRSGERVTAEEWKEMTQELDQATGGLYAELSQTFQRQVIRRAINLHNEEDKQLPKLPKGVFRVAVVTGFDAMGRTIEGQNLVRALGTFGELYGPQELVRRTDPEEALRRILVSENVRQDALVLDGEAVAAKEQKYKQDAMQQMLIDKGTGPAINAAAKAAPMLAQQGQQQGAPPGAEDTTPTPPQ